MKHLSWGLFVACVIAIGASGCQPAPQAATSQEVVQAAQAKATPQEKADFLVAQANAFLNSKNYDEAIKTAQYVLGNVDKNSTQARSVVEKATAELEKVARQKLEEMKGSADKTVTDVSKKLEAFGKK